MSRIRIDRRSCNACGICVQVCPGNVLTLLNGAAHAKDEESCLGFRATQSCSSCVGKVCAGCVACVRNCPTGAILIQ